MRLFLPTLLLFVLSSTSFTSLKAQDDWSRWRGPNGNGIAEANQKPPTSWDEDSNIAWKVKIPGRGHASPIILADKIFLATADEGAETQSVLCIDRKTGAQLWQTEINKGAFSRQLHPKNTQASPTIATDGTSVFAVFSNHQSVQLAALDLGGKILWQKKVGPYESNRPFGYGASPIVYESFVIVTNQCNGESAITAFDCKSGDQKWKVDCDKRSNYSTPVVATVAKIPQLLISGLERVTSYDPENGKQLWYADAKWEVTCATMVWDGDLVFASGGFPAQQTIAVKADGTGDIVWENSIKAYEQSMLAHDGYVYTHSENGGVYCWRASDGKEMWKQRFSSRNPAQSASPVLANGNLYFTAENGETLVIKANPEKMEEVSRNKLGDESFASLAVCGQQLFARVAIYDPLDDSRQEWLFCIGEKSN